jgi:hypothetical protein
MSWDFFIISGDIGEGNASTFHDGAAVRGAAVR